MNWYDLPLELIIIVFIAYEFVSHFVFHNRKLQTLSTKIRHLEANKTWGISVRVVVGASCLWLTFHTQGVDLVHF